VLVEFLDRVPIEVQLLGHILDRARPTSPPPPRKRQIARCSTGSRTENPTALPSPRGSTGNLPAAPRSPGTPACRNWAGRGFAEYGDRTNQNADSRRYRRPFFSPPREANEPGPVVTEDAFDELARSKAGEGVCIGEASSSMYLGHTPIVPKIRVPCTCIKPL
jgi:hypothetical protein